MIKMQFSRLFLFLLLSAVFSFCEQNRQSAPVTQTPEATPAKLAVNPPSTQFKVAPVVFQASADQATTHRMPSGSSVVIPAQAFVDAQGQAVTTPVNIKFREFHDPASVIASGIPMRVRGEHGPDEWMESAGMFEIEGFSADQPVFVAPGKQITVDLVSNVGGEYATWYFDPAAGNWVQTGTGAATPNTQVASEERAAPPAPTAPHAYNKSKPVLNFDLDITKYPDLHKLRNIVWQYAGKDAAQDPANNNWIFNHDWNDAKLDAARKDGLYQITLTSDEKYYSIPVYPCLKPADYAKAKAEYDLLVEEYKKNIAILAKKEAILDQQADFRRKMAVSGFGIYNHDIYYRRPDIIALEADFDFGREIAQAEKQLTNVYLVTAGGRTAISLPSYDWHNFRFSPEDGNMLIALLPDNRVATFSKADFAAALNNLKLAANGRYVFKMRVQQQSIASLDQLKALINS